MALTRWPLEPSPKLLPWAIWRFRNKEGPNPWPTTIPKYAWEFLQWAAWRRKGAIPADRPDVVTRIPQWGWSLLKQLNIAVPIKPPPPPPPPPNPDPPDSWTLPLPLMFTSWGWSTDSDWRDTDASIDRCVHAGIKTILLQAGMFKATDAQRCRDKGLYVAVWGAASSLDADALRLADADGYVVQTETPEETRNALANLTAGVGKGLSLAMVTTFGGLYTYTSRNPGTPQEHPTTVETEKLAEAGCTRAFVECYQGDMTPNDVSTMMHTGIQWRGLYYAQPVLGLNGTHSVSEYQPDIDSYGRQFGVYLGEPLRAIDWAAIKDL